MIIARWDAVDFDFGMFRSVAEALDVHLRKLRTWEAQADAESWDEMILLDIENTIGLGFAAAQTYIRGVCRWVEVDKRAALSHGPKLAEETVAAIVNAAANLWKHRDEWDDSAGHAHAATLRTLAAIGISVKTELPLDKTLRSLGGRTVADIGRVLLPWRDELLAIARARLNNVS